ncbi:MAG: hypothetical protein JXX29_01305 [Deltaproteobacteria bacterium]|nr:hypothetical protein [Deltaproteobacteria bacterium]MBN2670276.1 hypothetical protein [Deltaproteobacteria bacterium]
MDCASDTKSEEWGPSMFLGTTADAADFQEFGDMLPSLGLTARQPIFLLL